MGFINVAERTINAKLVYYGVGVGGKTTSLQQVHGIFSPRNEVQLLSISTEEDSTLMFDFLPINLGSIGGFNIRIKGYTVPGQPKYRRMRQYVLRGADAVVFVVDSQSSRLQENIESLESMRENLRLLSNTSESLPIVMQYNKRDLDHILSEEELDRHFRFRDDIQSFPTVATEGHGVFEAFVHTAGQMIVREVERLGLQGDVDAQAIADEARQRLWDACDEARRSRAVVPIEELPHVKVEVPEPQGNDVSGADAPAFGDGLAISDMAPPSNPDGGATAGMSDDLDEEFDWQTPQLLDEIQPTTAAPAPTEELGDEDFQLDYSLSEMAAPAAPPGSEHVLTNEDLDIPLDGLVDFESSPEPVAEAADTADDDMLDQSVEANLQLAQQFGELDEERLRYEKKLQELVEFTQSAVHDLKRPLSALGLMLKLVERGTLGDVPDKVREAVTAGLEGIEVMSKLVQDLLDSSQLDHDGVTLEFSECDLSAVAAEVARMLQFELDVAKVDVQILPTPVIEADPWGLKKALLNLFGNAIVYASPDRRPVIELGCNDDGDDWLVFVRDNGIGIPAADRSRLFKRFERGSNTSGISGSGLGLHIVREIVQGHGGTVSFESEEDVGTTFYLRLPKSPVLAPHSPVSDVRGPGL
ncbi:MAG: ATP-binding protein [bacterium]|nr:ATP-binding protein [bacterium]